MFGGRQGFLRLGDAVEGGGRVISASGSNLTLGGISAVMEGDLAQCDTHGAVFPIVEGCDTFRCDGKRVAFDGARLACGCRVLSSCNGVWGRDDPSDGYRAGQALPGFLADGHQPNPVSFDESLRFTTPGGLALAGLAYQLELADGRRASGTTDALGRTERVATATPMAFTQVTLSPADNTPTICCARRLDEHAEGTQVPPPRNEHPCAEHRHLGADHPRPQA